MIDIFMKSIVGYKNLIKSGKSQDYADFKRLNNMLICVVADGHSTEFFKYSQEGAKFACKACIEVLENYSNSSQEEWRELLKKQSVQKLIYDKWMDLVNEHYKRNNPVVFKTEYLKYSTTLVACCIYKTYTVSLKLGDGNIVTKQNNVYKKLINSNPEKIVHSLGRINAYENIKYSIDNINIGNNNSKIVLFTDGYENSFVNEIELYSSIEKTINKHSNNIFSRMSLYKKYESYLNRLSRNYSYDDISIIFVI